MSKLIDLTGQRFHYLTVLERASNTQDGKARWLCQCDCGRKTVVAAADLKKKRNCTKSCGCMSKQLIGESNKTHGMSHHPAFGVWHSMKQRCGDPNHPAYHNYGGRGIKVCPEWEHSFEQFWMDMGPTYRGGMELDRVDNNRGYDPQNCRWVTRKKNARNRRTNRVIESIYGPMAVSELSEKTGIGETTLLYRLDHGWPIESLCAPPDVRNRYTTSGTADLGTGSAFTTEAPGSSAL